MKKNYSIVMLLSLVASATVCASDIDGQVNGVNTEINMQTAVYLRALIKENQNLKDLLKAANEGLEASNSKIDILNAESKPSQPLLDGGKWLLNKGSNVCSTVWNKVPSMSDVKSASFQCFKNVAKEGKAIVTQPMMHKAVIGSGLVGLGLGGYAASKMIRNEQFKGGKFGKTACAVGLPFVGALGGVYAPYVILPVCNTVKSVAMVTNDMRLKGVELVKPVVNKTFDGFKLVSNAVCKTINEHPKTALAILGTVTVAAAVYSYYKGDVKPVPVVTTITNEQSTEIKKEDATLLAAANEKLSIGLLEKTKAKWCNWLGLKHEYDTNA